MNDSSFWTSYFKYYDVLLKVFPYQNLMKSLANNLQVSADEVVLDAGSGTGNINYFIENSCKMFALDSSEEALQRLLEKFPKVEVVKRSLTSALPFENNSFDKLVSNNVLYTIPIEHWHDIIAEFKRVLKPGGKLVIANPTKGFSPIKIYLKHILQSLKKRGPLKTIAELLTLVPDTIKMLRFNKVITNKESSKKYHFMSETEQIHLFTSLGFKSVAKTQKVYAAQGVLDTFVIDK